MSQWWRDTETSTLKSYFHICGWRNSNFRAHQMVDAISLAPRLSLTMSVSIRPPRRSRNTFRRFTDVYLPSNVPKNPTNQTVSMLKEQNRHPGGMKREADTKRTLEQKKFFIQTDGLKRWSITRTYGLSQRWEDALCLPGSIMFAWIHYVCLDPVPWWNHVSIGWTTKPSFHFLPSRDFDGLEPQHSNVLWFFITESTRLEPR